MSQSPMIRLLVLSLLLSSAFGAMVLAAREQPTAAPASGPTSKPAGKPINKFCPIEPDNEIDPKITVVYEGKIIGLCCNDCIREFNRDPDGYAKKAK